MAAPDPSDDQPEPGAPLAPLSQAIDGALRAISGSVELLRCEPLSPATRELAQRLLAAEEALRDLLQPVLEQVPATATPGCAVAPVLAEVVALALPLAHERRIVLLPPAENELAVQATPAQLQQIVLDLVINSIEALGGQPGRIELTAAEDAGRVAITVRDTGPGIAEPNRERIFAPARGGGGLGLVVARGLARQCGGDLLLGDARPGQTAFTVYLPRADGS